MAAEQNSATPKFENPPVTEVALSISFNRLGNLNAVRLGQLWSKFKREFPRTEEHPPLVPVVETFAKPKQSNLEISVETVFPAPRVWFLNEQGTELIQIQQDQFVHNWRKVEGDEEYPCYEKIKQTFLEQLEKFEEFLSSEQLGSIVPRQCEVTYVNHIYSGDGWSDHGELDKVIEIWGAKYSDNFLPKMENSTFASRHIIPGKNAEPFGRLHIKVEPRFKVSDGKPIFIMTLTARGRPLDEGIEGALQFLDVGHEWVVRGFTSITTAKMWKIWGKKDDS